MKKIIISLLSFGFLIFWACTPSDPTQPEDESINAGTLVLSKMVAVGNSLTAGFQSSGLVEDFQMHSYPYLIAQQMGRASGFQQPIVASPGVGSPTGYGPQKFDPSTGAITQDPLTASPVFPNALLPRAYDNLGIPGFDLNDAMNTLVDGGMADFILRNFDPTDPNNHPFGNTSQIEQAMGLSPTLLLLWLGNNDVLGAALDGGGLNGDGLSQITSGADFTSRLTDVLTYIRVDQGYDKGLVMANIPNVADIPYINMLDIIFQDSIVAPGDSVPRRLPVLVDGQFQPIVLPMIGMLPVITEETDVVHITLPGLLAYLDGYGIPDSTYLVDNGILPPSMAPYFVSLFMAEGITPKGDPIPGNMTITATEEAAIAAAVVGFNQIIGALAAPAPNGFSAPVLDANQLLSDLNAGLISGLSGKFVYMDPATTGFSLDGVHPNNAGYAFIANEFITLINATFGQRIPALDYTAYTGQYTGSRGLPKIIDKRAVEGVKELFRKQN